MKHVTVSSTTKSNLTNDECQTIYQSLLQESLDGELKKGSIIKLARQYGVCERTISRIWHRAKLQVLQGSMVDVSSKKPSVVGRKRIHIDFAQVSQIPLRRRSNTRSLTKLIDVPKSTIYRRIKEGALIPHTNAVKPLLTKANKKVWVNFCLSMITPSLRGASPTFYNMHNIIHIDEKWFYISKATKHYYLVPGEEEPLRTCKSKTFMTKVMFLAMVARPRFDAFGNEIFSGKISISPLTTLEPAKRSSKNRVAGTLETKPILSVTKELYDVKVVVRSTLKLLPEIKRLLSSNPNRLNLFRRTVFGPWMNLPSHYNDNHLMHYDLQHQDSLLIVNLDPTPAKKIQAWFDSSILYFNGIVDEDGKGCGDDYVLVSKNNYVDEDYNVCEDASVGLSEDEIVNDKLVDEDCNVYDDASAEAGWRNSKEDNENQSAYVSIRDLCAMIKVHEERIENIERLLKEKQPNDYATESTKPNMIPNHSDDIPSCSVPDLNSNQIVGCDGMEIDKPDQMNDYNCSQPILASVDALIQACAYAADHPELDVLQHEAHVDRSGPKINQHLMADPLTDDYMSVLNDEEMIPNVSLDDMKFQHEDENLLVKDTPLEHQPVDELIDAQKDTTNLLPENMKKRGLQKNYVLRYIQERKKRLAMALGSPYGQLGTTTPALQKTRSMTSIVDTIVAPKFEVEISGQPKIRSLNELMTLQVFVENLLRPDGCKKDKDLTVDKILWLQLACLDLAKKGWLGDSIGLWQAGDSSDCGVWV
uniref:DUF7769 domain-containing protein n=1 Tax=Tanacetum cinerariifolium TaxID=118510 RepID=A0A6L2NY95_TANCI|nr:hypothetical protein [Tanacetum cinerariifolium]